MAKENTIRNIFAIDSGVNNSGFIGGVELEIEDVRGTPNTSWNITEDGSLRNSGKEFISPPAKLDDLILGFKQIHATIKHSAKPQPFTERTSIHVHVNCLDLTAEETKSILLWYALFEPVFFALVAPNRKHNIHCVPLDQTTLATKYNKTLPMMVKGWSKYTALNLLPLQQQGTIEFRHMEGHNDLAKFTWWLTTIRNLWEYGRNNIMRKELITIREIHKAYDTIFQAIPNASTLRHSLLALIGDSLLDIKLSFI